MASFLNELLVQPSGMFNYATMNPVANIVCAWLALISNVALFGYWLYKIIGQKRNPITGVLFCELGAFRKVVLTHFWCHEKYKVLNSA